MSTSNTNAIGRRPLLVAMAAIVVSALTAGCSHYPRVSNGEGVKYIGALRTACSSKRLGRVDSAEAAIKEAHAEGSVTEAELSAFNEIIALAREGKWKEAEMAAYHFQQAQVR